jgi:nitrite reductase/ring-hydroxylating ferredoxin subunit
VSLGRDVFVAGADEIADGGRKVVEAGGVEIGVFNNNGAYFAWRNECPHQGGPVCQGIVARKVEERLDDERRSSGIHYVGGEGNQNIVCPWHGYEFDMRTGRHVGSARMRLRGYPVKVRDGAIYVVLPD